MNKLRLSVFILNMRITFAQPGGLIGQACNPAAQIFCVDPFAECFNGFCRCRAGSVQSGYNCIQQATIRRAMLNEACLLDSDCAAVWSQCKDHKCQCRPHYVKESIFECKPVRYFCPISPWFNEPLKAAGMVVKCISYTSQLGAPIQGPLQGQMPLDQTISRPQLRPSPLGRKRRQTLPLPPTQFPLTPFPQTVGCPRTTTDNCPVGTYCNSYHATDELPPNGYKEGICCTKPKPTCPTGEPLSTNPNEDCSNCPQDTHFCFCDYLTNVAACCPRACPVGNTYANGQCWPVGSAVPSPSMSTMCTNDNECLGGAKCAAIPGDHKQCLCPGGLNYINGMCTAALCASGQPFMGVNRQIQTCSPTIPCPPNYQCDFNHRVCCPAAFSGSASNTNNLCPPGEVFAGAMCNHANPACPMNSVCSASNVCCQMIAG